MRANRLQSVLLAFACSVALTAATAGADVTCKDGTTSTKTGRGACSHHGGVASAAPSGGGATAPATNNAPPAARGGTSVGTGAPAGEAAGTVTCKDGSQGKAGRGACSHHGGVASAGAAAAPAPMNERAPAATGADEASTGKSGGKHSDPTGATAQCKDGTYSHSQHRSGTCSRHGGVAKWL